MEQILVTYHDIQVLQHQGILKTPKDVEDAWKDLLGRCPLVSPTKQQSNRNDGPIIPLLQANLKPEVAEHDICIAYSRKNGSQLAQQVLALLKSRNLRVVLATDPETENNWNDVERTVASSISLVVLLTQKCLRELDVLFSMTAAKFYLKHVSQIILVHDAGSCLFPGHVEQPSSLSEIFSEKAITFLSCYAEKGIDQVVEKFETEKKVLESTKAANPTALFAQLLATSGNTEQIPVAQFRNIMSSSLDAKSLEEIIIELDQNKDGMIDMMEFSQLMNKSSALSSLFSQDKAEEDISTRFFLSHKRSTGQAIAGRLYEGLRSDYKVFLDSEAKFKIHNLEKIVECTRHFIFILSSGIFQSKWCLEELKSAVANKKPITVIRELGFAFPEVLPVEWQPYEAVLKSAQLVWIAEYNQACVEAIKMREGPPDEAIKFAELAMPNLIHEIETQGALSPDRNQLFTAFFHLTKNNKELWSKIKTLNIGYGAVKEGDQLWLKDLYLPSVESISGESEIISRFMNHERIRKADNFKPCALLPNIQSFNMNADLGVDVLKYCGETLEEVMVYGSVEGIDEMSSKFPRLRKFSANIESLPAISAPFQTVTSLELWVTLVEENTLSILQKGFPNLTHLTFSVKALVPNEHSLVSLLNACEQPWDKITSLDVEFMTREDIKAIAASFPNLQSLRLAGGDDEEFLLKDLQLCQHLTKLYLASSFSPEQLSHLLPLLSNLEEFERYVLPASFAEEFGKQSPAKLKLLKVSEWPETGQESFFGPGFAKLEVIDGRVFDPIILKAIAQMPNITSLSIMAENLEIVKEIVPRLKSLEISCATPEAIEFIFEHGKQLKRLHLNIDEESYPQKGNQTADVLKVIIGSQAYKKLPLLEDLYMFVDWCTTY